ncbi:DNA polymerase III subunit gamma/tau [Sporohalobacter salinus]|uniref:DNA polymerase III subunit gamma/tau n=1 Tax=Sporohalobacter salinus TaxID=1494606 RepID=UPI00195F54A3|nr:DNA polymerase III subunit gamma/tau [Sporohalobacter salinus]MBM7623953.1 DNA polymerase-3 subunit gamma/tau [Sporohalobacter salinus]
MSYLSLYRKWRPQTFEDIVGQQSVIQTLKNAIKFDRIAHAYLFCGPRGTGKTSTAKVFSKSLNCNGGPTISPCGECESCQKIEENSSIDVIEIDAASNRGIDEIRELREKVKFFPTEGNYKVYIIDEAHMLTKEAFNALLKTLEEPPEYVIFILATTEPHSLLSTILSRCQRFDFSRLSVQNLVQRLNFISQQEEIDLTTEAALAIARSAEGGMRDGISLLDQIISYSGKQIELDDVAAVLGLVDQKVLFEMMEVITNNQVERGLSLINDIVNKGKDLQQFVNSLIDYFRNLLIEKECQQIDDLIELPEEQIEKIKEQSNNLTTTELLRLVNILVELESDLKQSNYPQVLLEMGIIKLIKPEVDTSQEGILDRLTRLEDQVLTSKPSSNQVLIDNKKTEKVIKENQKSKSINKNKKIRESKKEVTESKEKTKKRDTSENNISLSKIQQRWTDVLKYLQKNEARTHAMLKEGKLSAVDGNRLIIAFNKKHGFHKDNVDRKAGVIEKIIKKVLGLELKVKTIFSGNNKYENSGNKQEEKNKFHQNKDKQSAEVNYSNKTSKKAKDSHLKAAEDPLVKEVLDVFDGEIIKVEED